MLHNAARAESVRQRGRIFLNRKKKRISKTHDCQSIVGFLFSSYRSAEAELKREREITMTKETKWVTPWFEPETRFDVVPNHVAPFRATSETEFDRLKARLLGDLLDAKPDPDLNPLLRRAANEAAGLAWLTPFPMLFFPTLLEEKATAAARHATKQREIRWGSPRFSEKAAA